MGKMDLMQRLRRWGHHGVRLEQPVDYVGTSVQRRRLALVWSGPSSGIPHWLSGRALAERG